MKKSLLLIFAAFIFGSAFIGSVANEADPVKDFMKKNADNSIEIEVIEFERDWVEFKNWGIRIGEKPTDVTTGDEYRKDKQINQENSTTLKLSYSDMLAKYFSVEICSMQSSSSKKVFAGAKKSGWVYVNIWLEGEKASKTLQEICSRVINGYNMKGMEALSKDNSNIENGSLIYRPADAPSGLKKIKLRMTPTN